MFSVIIVNHNLTNNIIESVKSVLSFISENEYEIIIVDNNSSQGEKKSLTNALGNNTHVKISFLDSNKGFGYGNNFGIAKASGDILFLLNPDTLITSNIFKDVKEMIERFPEISVLGPKIYNENKIQEKSIGIFPNLFLEFLNIFFLNKIFEKRYFNKKVKENEAEFLEVDWVTGSAIFIRKSIFESIGGFDTNFFMYSEEIDLCKRIKDTGG
ncbi:MAG TPA: glycosyltransferase family 2 protein, partial [Ignavibacteriaceae bacterium]|nr:glycosyltransferase family 2 protein [Ignavibacteriaceae bacterium]